MHASVEILVEGMGCQKCVEKVEKAVRAVSPEAKVRVDLPSGKVTIENAAIGREELAHAIEDAGYDIRR